MLRCIFAVHAWKHSFIIIYCNVLVYIHYEIYCIWTCCRWDQLQHSTTHTEEKKQWLCYHGRSLSQCIFTSPLNFPKVIACRKMMAWRARWQFNDWLLNRWRSKYHPTCRWMQTAQCQVLGMVWHFNKCKNTGTAQSSPQTFSQKQGAILCTSSEL